MKILTGLAVLTLATSFRIAPDRPSAKGTPNISGTDLPKVLTPSFPNDTLTISKFGAVADGLTLNTTAINVEEACCIGRCTERQKGYVVSISTVV